VARAVVRTSMKHVCHKNRPSRKHWADYAECKLQGAPKSPVHFEAS